MILYNIPLLMVLAFLLLTLVTGLYVSQKATTFHEYAVGNKRFHTTTLVVTVLATAFGGGTLMRNVPKVHSMGIYFIFVLCAIAVGFWISSLMMLRMGPFMDNFSVAETIGSVYGKYPRAIAAVLGICFSIGIVAIQINVMSAAIGMCIDSIDPRIVTVLATLILIAYAMFGGARAVTITDILQFATFTIIIPLLIRFVFVKTSKSFLEVIVILQNQEKFHLSTLFQCDEKLLKPVLQGIGLVCWLNPSVVHGVYMSSGPIQAYKVFLRVTFFSAIIMACTALIGLFVFVGDPTLSETKVWPYILADMPPVYKGCILISLLGMTMSTADSNLHTASIMVSHDMVESIRGIKVVPYIHQLRLAKLTALVTGLLAMVVTVCYPDLFQLSHFVFTFLIISYEAIIVAPFILAVFGFRGSVRTALTGMTIGILVALILTKWYEPKIGIGVGFFSMLANGLAMMAAHYLLRQPADKGWVRISSQQKRMRQLIRTFKKYKKSIDLE